MINHNEDLKHLQDDGYQIEIKAGLLLIHQVPYVNVSKKVSFGTLVSTLTLSGDKTTKPDHHICYFKGDAPCNSDGNIITAIKHSDEVSDLAEGVSVDRSFSSKPSGGYQDYYEKMTSYCKILENEAQGIDPSVSAKNHSQSNNLVTSDPVFCYPNTHSSRAGIGNITQKLSSIKIAIIGLGGTGSYLLDFLAKTEVKEIHIFDDDILKNHNAFRVPGAVPKEILEERITKVAYLYKVYSQMRKGIKKI